MTTYLHVQAANCLVGLALLRRALLHWQKRFAIYLYNNHKTDTMLRVSKVQQHATAYILIYFKAAHIARVRGNRDQRFHV